MKKFLIIDSLRKLTCFLVTAVIAFCICFGLYLAVEKRVYPVKYKEEIILYSSKYNLDFYQVVSLIKIESDFEERAVSKKGAKGLMQIIDSTAQFIAEELNVLDYDLFNAETNIRFGCYYLRYLMNRFSVINTALCAYNAGEGNVSDWLQEKSLSFDGKTLDFIPFKETREYIDKFEKSLTKYKKLYKNILDK